MRGDCRARSDYTYVQTDLALHPLQNYFHGYEHRSWVKFDPVVGEKKTQIQNKVLKIEMVGTEIKALKTLVWHLSREPMKETPKYKDPFENIVLKRENAGNQHFLLIPQCFLPF